MPFTRALVATSYRRCVLALALLTLGWRAWTASRWTWQDDDWVYLANAASMPLSDYVMQMYNGHLMPGEFLVMWVITRLAPLDYTVPLLITSMGSAAIVLLWGRAFSHLAGERRWLLAPLGLMSISPLLIRPTIWWASALQVLPLQACLAWGVLVAARMASAPTRRGTTELAAAFVVALFFWEKAVLLVLPLAMVLLCAKGGTILGRLRLHWRPLAVLTTLASMYSVLYLLLGRRSGDQREKGINFSDPPSWLETSDFMSSGLGNLLAPGALGGPWGSMPTVTHAYAVASPLVNGATSMLLVVAASFMVATRRASWVPLVGAVAYTLVSWGLVLFSSRFVNLGTIAINDERYTIDCFAVMLLAFVLGFARPPREPGKSALRTLADTRTVRVAAAGVLAISIGLGNVLAVQRIGIAPAKPWVDTVTRELDARDRVTLVESTAPDQVLAPSYWLEYAKTSRMLSPLQQVSFTEPAPHLQTVSETGRLVPVDVSADSRSEPGPVAGCGYTVAPGQSVTIRMSQDLFAWNWVVRVDTFAAVGGQLVLDLGEAKKTVSVGSGLQSWAFPFSGTVTDQIRATIDGETACVTSVIAGNPTPES